MKKNIKVWKSSLGRINNLREKVALVSLGAFLSIAFTSVANEGVNPFNPIFDTTSGSSAAEYVEDDTGVHPLQQYQVSSYTLVALISSKKAKIAMVKVKNGQEYFVRMNDALGNSSGRVTSFTKNGLEITQKDEVITLVVRNKGSR
jgi:type IV pilus assembly protein PilP